MIALLMALQISVPERPLMPIEPAAAIDLFKRVCVDPFPDAARFEAAAGDPALGMARVAEEGPLAGIGGGSRWTRDTAEVRYAAGPFPGGLPVPQCVMTVRLPAAPDEAAFASALAAALAIGPGKTSGGKRWPQTRWDLPRPNGGAWRLFVKVDPGSPNLAQMTLLNIGKTK